MTPRRASSTPRAKTETPWFPIALACLFAVGCAADARRRAAAGETTDPEPPPAKKPLYMSFQVDPESDLFDPAQKAAADWSAALGRSVTVTPDGEIPIFRVEGSCHVPAAGETPNNQFVAACAKDLRTPDARIEVSHDAADWELYTTLKHEMGHHLAGSAGHVEGNPDALMYAYKPLGSPNVITHDDLLFVCKGFDCNPTVLNS